MIVKKYIQDFEQLGLGMFVHFGIYSQLGKGEWAMKLLKIPKDKYAKLATTFCPKPNWAKDLAATAKNAGCKYITITTRHHDGYSLYDTCGLTEYDAPHSCGRDFIKEFVDACRETGLIPFFYHTLIDWYAPDYPNNWEAYMTYLQRSVELLCTNYGQIGGLWFDGMWEHWENDWQEDTLYGIIRKHQTNCMIINNTGLGKRGQLGHIELDSVTFERGKPHMLNMEGAPKYIASEMCEVLNSHWGYAAEDMNYKSPATIIQEIAQCRSCGSNMLLNIGPMADGSIHPLDIAYLELIGRWVRYNDEAIRAPRPSGIEVPGNDFLLKDGSNYYLFCHKVERASDSNVSLENYSGVISFNLSETVTNGYWLDCGEPVEFKQEGNKVTVLPMPYHYGQNLVVRVAKLICE